jgi:predicted kinase
LKEPFLIVVTGRPASGKSTLAHLLARETRCPVISRDELKEGYIRTVGVEHKLLDDSIALELYQTFFNTIDLLVTNGISVIAEAAFQHKLWKPKLSYFDGKTRVRILVCDISPKLARKRFSERLINDPDRGIMHGDNLPDNNNETASLIDTYYAPVMPVPTLIVNTNDGYKPGLSDILVFLGVN